MMKKGIVSFDIDMTLLDHKDYRIPDSAMRAIELLREQYYVVIATGRDMDAKFSLEYKGLIHADAMIHLNGTKVTVGDTTIFEHCMDRTLVERLLRFAQGKPFAIGMTVGMEDYYVNPQVVTVQDMMRWQRSDRNFRVPWKLLELPVRTMVYIGPESWAKVVEAEFPEVKLPMFAGRTGSDVVEKAVSKADGLRMLCRYFGISEKNTIAFGDSMNDLEIIQAAGTGVAMGNGVEELKKAADYVTSDIGEDGVWNACVRLGLIQG